MTRTRFSALFVLAALLLIAPLVASVGADRVLAQDAAPAAAESPGTMPLAETMPADTAAYVATAFDPTSDQFLALSSLAARLIIPSAGDTIASIVEQLTRLLAMIPSDLSTVLEGEIGIGVTGFGSFAGDGGGGSSNPGAIIGSLLPGYAIVLHPIAAGEARGLVEEWFADQVDSNGGDVERTEVGSIVVLRDSTVDDGESAAPSVIAFSGDYIFFGTDYESLLPFIETSLDNAPSLADAPELKELNAALPADRLLFGYLDPAVFLESTGNLEISSVEISSIEAPIGETAFTIAASDNELRFESVSMPTSMAEGLIDTRGPNPAFADAVPASTLALYAGQDLGRGWAIDQLQKILLTTLVGSMGGGEIDLSEFDAEEQFGFLSMLTGINFKTDMFDQLTGDFGLALFSLDTEDPLGSSAVIASELENPDLVSVAVTSLGPLIQSSGAGMASVTTASIDGQTVNNVAVTTEDLNVTVQYGVVDDQLMIGLGDGIEMVAVEPTDALSSSPAYQAALAELPADYDSVMYLDVQGIADQLAPVLLETIAEDSDSAIVRCLAGTGATESATPDVADLDRANDGGWIVDTGCSVLNSLLGGDGALLDVVVSHLPGPLAAVSYHQDGLKHTSGVLMVGSLEP
ncbi:MAG: DUF3352 domain-containing protein [Thermomicrobiales bacterium]|nr:MAG: DUF3352 domain-containing protein [Thermomicrobiales bacterium]